MATTFRPRLCGLAYEKLQTVKRQIKWVADLVDAKYSCSHAASLALRRYALEGDRRASSPSGSRFRRSKVNRLKWLNISMLLAMTLSGCGGGGASGSGLAAPTALNYPPAPPFVVNQSIAVLTPHITGTDVTYSVTPALPAGLSLNPATGTISGTPSTAAPIGAYTVTAMNSAGNTTAGLAIVITNLASANVVPEALSTCRLVRFPAATSYSTAATRRYWPNLRLSGSPHDSSATLHYAQETSRLWGCPVVSTGYDVRPSWRGRLFIMQSK